MPESKDPIEAGEIDPKPTDTAAQVADPTPVKAYLTTYTKVKAADLAKETWTKPDDIIGAAVKLHGATMESYRNSGLG